MYVVLVLVLLSRSAGEVYRGLQGGAGEGGKMTRSCLLLARGPERGGAVSGIPAVGGRTSHRYQYMPFTSYQVPDTVPG